MCVLESIARTCLTRYAVAVEEAEVEIDEVVEESSRELKLPHVQLVELSLVALALILWLGAIVLFFHRWGKLSKTTSTL